mmetsp:Transcript_28334/g.72595  ORF Transcript_28334/g.72595 Transcript_28334/m.72595 type:complete len:247 (+) Transcript_28334:151-891(+)
MDRRLLHLNLRLEPVGDVDALGLDGVVRRRLLDLLHHLLARAHLPRLLGRTFDRVLLPTLAHAAHLGLALQGRALELLIPEPRLAHEGRAEEEEADGLEDAEEEDRREDGAVEDEQQPPHAQLTPRRSELHHAIDRRERAPKRQGAPSQIRPVVARAWDVVVDDVVAGVCRHVAVAAWTPRLVQLGAQEFAPAHRLAREELVALWVEESQTVGVVVGGAELARPGVEEAAGLGLVHHPWHHRRRTR